MNFKVLACLDFNGIIVNPHTQPASVAQHLSEEDAIADYLLNSRINGHMEHKASLITAVIAALPEPYKQRIKGAVPHLDQMLADPVDFFAKRPPAAKPTAPLTATVPAG